MSYFIPYIDATGLHLPTYADRLDALCSAYRAIFGQDAELSASVPDYQLLSALARALDDTSALVLSAYNSRNPAYAAGQALDLLLPQYGLSRRGATCSAVTLTLSGKAGTLIPAGQTVADQAGYLWVTTAAATIGTDGTASVSAACQTPGPVYAAANTITTLVSTVTGWTSVTNPAASSLGENEETDAELRARITSALAARGTATAESIEAAIRNVDWVRDVLVHVNDTDAADAQGVPAHSVAAVVYMGDTQAIAEAIFAKKAPGIGTYGTTQATVTDSQGNAHAVYFSRSSNLATQFVLKLTAFSGYDATTVQTLIKNAIRDYVNALPIGQPLNVPQLFGVCYAAVGAYASTFAINSITAATTAGSSTERVSPAWNQRLSTTVNSITFTS